MCCCIEYGRSLQWLCILYNRYHLKGINAGHAEVFVDNLPCLPDNIRPSSSGGYWIACGTVRYEGIFNAYDCLGPRPWIRWLVSKVSTSL